MTNSQETLRPDSASIFLENNVVSKPKSLARDEICSTKEASPLSSNFPRPKVLAKSTPHAKRKETRTSRSKRLLERVKSFFARERWTFEASCLLLSTLLVAIMVIVLHLFDHRPLTDWPLPITLNAFVSLIVTFLYMFLMVPTSSCLSQLKWNHFRRAQSLYDFQKYDDASRGVFGAFRILFSRKKSLLTLLFAVLVIAVSAIGPLTQQILQFATSEFPLPPASHNASLPITRYIDATEYEVSGLNVQSDVYSAAFANRRSNFTVTPECPASNCTWPELATLAVEQRTTDISASIQRASQQDISDLFGNITALSNVNGHLSNRTVLSLAEPFSNVNLTASEISDSQFGCPSTTTVTCLDGGNSSTYKPGHFYTMDMSYLRVVPVNAVQTGDWHGLVVVYQELNLSGVYQPGGLANASLNYGISKAWSHMFQFVVKPLQARQINGKFTETPAGDSMPLNITGYGDCSMKDDSCVPFDITLNGLRFAAASRGLRQYAVYLDALSGFTSMNGWLSDAGWIQTPAENDPKMNMMYGFLYSAFLQIRESGLTYEFVSQRWNLTLDDMMNNIADGLTSTFRTHSSDRVQGTAYITATVYLISWQWISIPAALLALTIGLTIATAVETRLKGMPTWTDSSLATIFFGIDDASRSEFLDMRTVEELERASRKLRVQIAEKEFSLQQVNSGGG